MQNRIIYSIEINFMIKMIDGNIIHNYYFTINLSRGSDLVISKLYYFFKIQSIQCILLAIQPAKI